MPLQAGLVASAVNYLLMSGLTIAVGGPIIIYLAMQKHSLKGLSPGAVVDANEL